MARVPRDLDAPAQRRACERHVDQALLDERQRLVVAVLRAHPLGAVGVELLEPLLEGRELEEVVLLLLPDQRDLVDRAAVALEDLLLGLEVRAARAVPALVLALVDVAVVVDLLQHVLDRRHVLGIRRADEEVVGGADLLRHVAEADRVAVAELARGDALALGRDRHGLTVLVGPREEEHVLSALAHVAGQDVRRDRRVRVPQMGLRVHVVDRGRDVVGHWTRLYPRPASGRRIAPAALRLDRTARRACCGRPRQVASVTRPRTAASRPASRPGSPARPGDASRPGAATWSRGASAEGRAE